jgi:hypothetical protein
MANIQVVLVGLRSGESGEPGKSEGEKFSVQLHVEKCVVWVTIKIEDISLRWLEYS